MVKVNFQFLSAPTVPHPERIPSTRKDIVNGRVEERADLGRVPVQISPQQLSQLTGLTTRSLRFYEVHGLMTPPDRTAGNHRVYNAIHVFEALRIKRFRGMGFSVDTVRDLLHHPPVDGGAAIAKAQEDRLAKREAEIAQQRTTIARLLSLGAPFDVVPEFSEALLALRGPDGDNPGEEFDIMVIEIVSSLGSPEDARRLREYLERMKLLMARPEYTELGRLDEELSALPDDTPESERERLASALTAVFGKLSAQENSRGLTIDESSLAYALVESLVRASFNDALNDVFDRVRFKLAEATAVAEPSLFAAGVG